MPGLGLGLSLMIKPMGGERLVPTTLVFSTQPGDAVAGSPFGQQPVVTVKDQHGNTLESFTGIVTIDGDIDNAPFNFSGDDTVAAVAGVATFTDLEFNVGGNATLTASIASPSIEVESDEFIVLAAAVDDFITRTGITDEDQIAATNELYIGLDNDGLLPLLDAFFPFVGGTAQAHAENLLSSSFPWTWTGGITHDANGITGNGSTGWGTNTFRQSEHGVTNSVGHYSYLRTANPTGWVGATRATTGAYYHGFAPHTDAFFQGTEQSSGNVTMSCGGNGLGNTLLCRTDANTVIGFHEDEDASDGANASSADLCEGFEAILVRHWGAGGGDLDNFSDANIAAWAFTRGVNQAQFDLLRARVNTFQAALGRDVV